MKYARLTQKQSYRSERITGIAFVIVIVSIYAFFTTQPLREGPSIVEYTIIEDENNPHLVTLSGQTKHTTRLFLNGQIIPLSEDGKFEKSLLLHPGYTIWKLEGEDRFGKQTEEILNLFQDTETLSIHDIVEQRSIALKPKLSDSLEPPLEDNMIDHTPLEEDDREE